MSDYEAHRGRLIVFDRREKETDKDYTERFFKELKINFDEEQFDNEGIREFLGWHLEVEKGVYVNNKFYLNVNHKEIDPFEDIQELEGNDQDGYTYFMRFYNGGTCLTEMIEEAFENK